MLVSLSHETPTFFISCKTLKDEYEWGCMEDEWIRISLVTIFKAVN